MDYLIRRAVNIKPLTENTEFSRWSCHFDDDNYVNVDELIKTLRGLDPNEDLYLGRPSTSGPVRLQDQESKVRSF